MPHPLATKEAMTHALHITLAQINPVVGDLPYNREKIRKVIAEEPHPQALIVFPELAVCGYPPEDLVLKPFFLERVEQVVTAITQDSAAHTKTIILPAPHYDPQQHKIYNAFHLIGGGRIIETRHKHHLPNYGVFDEARIFARGPLPAPVEFSGHKLGVIICEDMWQPDVAEHMKAQGAELLIVVNASPYELRKNEERLALARQRIAETGLPLIYLNQCGGQDELVFDGASFVMNEDGQLITQAEEFAEDIRRTTWEKAPGSTHFLCAAGQVTPVHDDLEAIYQALVTGLRDYVGKNGFPGVLLGMSGGIDSALSAAIAVDALGAAAVHAVMMPSRFTSRESLDDAAEAAAALGISYQEISIESPVAAFEQILAAHFTPDTPATTHENIQPRCRGLILMALSNASGQMVLSTGNKSEMAVGYATLYGDMCGGFNVLKDVYKTQVFALARWRNENVPDHSFGPQGTVIPPQIISKPPTAELKPDQTDQDTLPPYEALDDILASLIEHERSIADITVRGHDEALVRHIWRLLDSAEYKRRQAPPGVKITARAFGRDRRYPITNRFAKIIEKSG